MLKFRNITKTPGFARFFKDTGKKYKENHRKTDVCYAPFRINHLSGISNTRAKKVLLNGVRIGWMDDKKSVLVTGTL